MLERLLLHRPHAILRVNIRQLVEMETRILLVHVPRSSSLVRKMLAKIAHPFPVAKDGVLRVALNVLVQVVELVLLL